MRTRYNGRFSTTGAPRHDPRSRTIVPIDAASIADQLLLGRYRVLEERGKGGFGTVNVCWDPRLMRRVAIKTIPLHMPEPVVRAPKARRGYTQQALEDESAAELRRHDMLLRAALAETRTASMLAHPNIVAMLDFESDDENAYIIMEYVEGASLAELLDATEDGLLTSDEAAAVVEGVCDALQFAHDNGVLHLDIKPDNILVEMSGRVRLADFGMAALSSATGYAGARGGTVGYMPPEQIEGVGVDVRTDVFAFASVMYEALTGLRPFAAPTPSQSLELVERGVADPCALNEQVDPRAADALLEALNPNPDIRPEGAEAFADQILAGLGRPKAGRKSLASFVTDVLDDSEAGQDEEATDPEADLPYFVDEDPDAGPVFRSFPRLTHLALRIGGAYLAAAVAAIAVKALTSGATPVAPLIAAVAVAVLGYAAPTLGSALALVALVVASFATGSWLAALAVLLAGAAWWQLVARERPLGSAPTLLGVSTGASPVGALLCGWLLPLGPACLCAVVSATACWAVTELRGMAVGPTFWIAHAGLLLASAATSALCHNGSKTRCYLGCLAGGAIVLAFDFIVSRMENGGSWTTLPPEVLAAAAGSTILACICVFLFGTPRATDVDGVDADWNLEELQESEVAL